MNATLDFDFGLETALNVKIYVYEFPAACKGVFVD